LGGGGGCSSEHETRWWNFKLHEKQDISSLSEGLFTSEQGFKQALVCI
jgi:hypothetical protein